MHAALKSGPLVIATCAEFRFWAFAVKEPATTSKAVIQTVGIVFLVIRIVSLLESLERGGDGSGFVSRART